MPSSPAPLTILQVLSWLNFGGVESYAIRLGRALQSRGHRVIIVSSGGQMEPELEASGLEHHRLDFTGLRLLAGARQLRRLLEQEGVDVVNAHNWRAGLVAHLACRRAGVPHLLTIHGTRRPVLPRAVGYWSRLVAVVSEASRENLVRDFGLPPDRVVLTRIGVDCQQFAPREVDPGLERELGLRPGAPRILHVSRFSHSKAPVAKALIAVLPELTRTIPEVELVLIGQGPQEAEVNRLAEEMNLRLGRRAAVVLGGRPDVPRLLSLATVVVATATTALEAMASAKPVIAAGKAGYFGVVHSDRLSEAERSCFGDHGRLPPIATSALAADLARLLSHPAEQAALGAFGREAALSRYDTSRVAAEVETIYHRVVCDRAQVRRILVFHLNQIGDLAFTLPALKALRQAFPSAHLTSVVRPHLADLVARSNLVDEIVHRPQAGAWRALSLGLRLRRHRADLAITLSQSASVALCAWLSGAPHRVGYVDSDLGRLLNHRVQTRGIPCPRKVLRLLRALAVPAEKQDYVGLISLSEEDRAAAGRLLEECAFAPMGPLIALAPAEASPRPYKAWHPNRFLEVARRLATTHDARLLVVGSAADQPTAERIVGGLRHHARNLAGRTTLVQLAALLACCDLLIGIDSGPLHLAAAMGTPVVALFGPTDPRLTGPMGEGHEVIFHRQECWRPCIHPQMPRACDRRCMDAISPEEVVQAAERILARRRG